MTLFPVSHTVTKSSPRLALVLVLILGATAPAAAPGDEKALAREILSGAGVAGGLIVHLPCGDGKLTAALRADDRYLVHGLDPDTDNVARARAHLRSQGLTGPVSVALLTGGRLPYVDGLVNLLVVEDLGGVAMEEVLRVLAPGGVAYVKRAQPGKAEPQWTKQVKPRPAGMGDWSHHMYDATGIGTGRDTLVSQPRSMQWKAGPEYGRSHENMSSVSVVVSAGGRVFSIMDEGALASIYLPAEWSLTARDAFSGVRLWKLPIRTWHARLFPLKSGPHQVSRRLVAAGDRAYATLGLHDPVSEIDAATGKVLRTHEGTAYAEELLLADGKLIVLVNDEGRALPYQGKTPASRQRFRLPENTIAIAAQRSIAVIDTATGKTVWAKPQGSVIPLTMVADAGRIYVMVGGTMRCLDAATGRVCWETPVVPKSPRAGTSHSPTVLVHKGIVYAAVGGKLNAFDAGKGKGLWSAPCAQAGYKAPASIFIVNDLIWDVSVGGEPYRPGSDPNKINRFYTGYDLRTGEARKKLPVSGKHGYAIMHHRCHIPRASGPYIITSFPGIEFFNVKTGTVTHDSWIRGACLYGFMPANGLLYTPPHPCACYTQGKLTGFCAVAGDRKKSRARRLSSDSLQKGPAYGAIRNPNSAIRNAVDWPTYRGDAARSGTAADAIPRDVKTLWSVKVGEGLSQCVIAGSRAFVATVDDHTVHALDAGSGNRLWQYTAGGRVDSAPTVYRGTVLFGSRDGTVTCLTADKGELVWRFRAAPADERCVAYDQVESVWPVHGSVLVQDDVLWFCAGRSSFLDGGLLVYRLNPHTGKVLSMTRVDTLGPDDEQPPITSTIFARLDMEGAKNDVLSSDGAHVFMRHWAFDAKGKSIERNIDHLFSPTGFLDASWFRRTYWIYGRMYVSGAQGWARTGNVRPTGRILSIDEDRIYGFGRNFYPPSPGNQDQMYLKGEQEVLFASARSASGTVTAPDAGGRRTQRDKKPKTRKKAGRKAVLWSTPGDLQVRCMVLAGQGEDKRLFIAGAKGDWVISPDAYEGKLGTVLRVLSIADGKTLAEHKLPAPPVQDGMSAAGGKLYIVTRDGHLLCLAGGK